MNAFKLKALDHFCFSEMLEQQHGQPNVLWEADLNEAWKQIAFGLGFVRAEVKTTPCHQAHCIMSHLIQLQPTQCVS